MTVHTTGGVRVTLYDTSGRPHFGGPGGGGGGEPTPGPVPVDPADLTTLRHVVSHAATCRFVATAGPDGSTIMSRHVLKAPAKSIRVRFGGHGQLALSGRGWVLAYGTRFPLTVDGAHHASGTGHILTDPFDSLVLQAGDVIHVAWEADPGSGIPDSGHTMPGLWSRCIDGPWDGALPGMADGNLSLAPPQILGLTYPDQSDRPLSVGLIGDSFTQPGWARSALEAHGLAWTDLTRWLEGTPTSREPLASRLGPDGPTGFDVIVTSHGGNNSTGTLAEQQATHIANWRWIEATGVRVAAMTLHPYTTSTDRWATVESQTPTPERRNDDRIARNDWLRDGAPLDPATDEPGPTGTTDTRYVRTGHPDHPLDYPVFDQADACETARNSGLWRVEGGAWTVDGVHLTQHGSAMLQPYFEAWVREHLT